MPELDRLRAACARPLDHPDAGRLHECADQVVRFLLEDFTALGQARVGVTASRDEMNRLLAGPPPEEGASFEQVLDEFRAKVVAHSFRPQHPRFLAFIPGAPSFYSVLGDWLCDGMNFFAGVWLEASGPAEVELVVLDWFKQLLGLPAEAEGVITGGGSEATLTALVAAREQLSFEDRARAVLYASDQRHWSFDRAARIAGFRPDQVRTLPADAGHRLTPGVLDVAANADGRAGRKPWFLLANAGTTNTGSVDPLDALADVARERRMWLHVDAAYGWAGVLDPTEAGVLAGIGRADSITLDPHKWFAQTFDAGCVLVRRPGLLQAAFAMRPEYMQDVHPGHDEVNFADRGIALTRRFRALKIWLSVKVLGVAWFRRLVAHCRALAGLSQHLLEQAGCFEILSPRQLGIVGFRFVPPGGADTTTLDRINLAIFEELRRTGRFFLSTTRLRGQVALRLCFVNWRTTAADVEELVPTLRAIGERLAAG